MVPKWLQEGCPEASWRALAADVDFWSILGSILEAKMAPKMEEMNLKCEPKNKQEFEVAFSALRRRPGGHVGSILGSFWENFGVA